MNAPETTEHIERSAARVTAAEAAVRDCVKGENVLVQLDAVLSAYLNLATQHGKQMEAAEGLLQLGGTLLFRLQLQAQPWRQQHPRPADGVDYPPAPNTVQ